MVLLLVIQLLMLKLSCMMDLTMMLIHAEIAFKVAGSMAFKQWC